MSIRALPTIELRGFTDDDEADAPDRAVAEWEKFTAIRLVAPPDGVVIDIMDEIGRDPFTGGGIGAADVRQALAGNEGKPVTVNINSPGGSFFEGNGIYCALAQHKGKVSVNILGVAGSAASFVAMAGDEIRIVENGAVMIHNASGITIGDHRMHEKAADDLAGVDGAIRGIYAKRTGRTVSAIEKMMDEDTWMWGKDAVKQGFADSILPDASVRIETVERRVITAAMAKRALDHSLAKGEKMPRRERRAYMNLIAGSTPSADPGSATQDAGLFRQIAAEFRSILNG